MRKERFSLMRRGFQSNLIMFSDELSLNVKPSIGFTASVVVTGKLPFSFVLLPLSIGCNGVQTRS